ILIVVLNLILVPIAGMLGAAVSQCIAYLCIAVGIGVISHRLYPLDVRWLKLGMMGLGGTLAGMVMSLPWHANPFLSLAIKSPFIVMISWSMAWQIAPDWCKRLRRV